MSEESQVSVMDSLPRAKLEAYFDPSRGKYWMQISNGTWTASSKEDTLYALERLGYNTKPHKGKSFSEADDELARIRMERSISFAGPVAGNMAGIRKLASGEQYLVTSSPTLPTPTPGNWDHIRTLGERLFGAEAFEYVLGWSANAVRSLHTNRCRRGQLLVLAGPAQCGKSFWQNRVISPLLGGRVARPIQYMLGQTSFNEDIIKSEHLMMEDESSKTDIRSRRHLGTNIKNFTVNVTQRVHPKGRDAFVVESSHYMSMSLNDESENLAILPLFDDSIEDKIMLIHCRPAINAEWPGQVSQTYLEDAVLAEMGAFTHYLLHEHVIRAEIADYRFGVRAYHDKDLLVAINALSPEEELAVYIEQCYQALAKDKKPLVMNSIDIQTQLEQHPDLGLRAKRLLPHSTSCGVYLERLHKRYPALYVKPNPRDRPRKWTINWPT